MPNKITKEVTYDYLYNFISQIKKLKEIKASYAFNKTLLNNEEKAREVLKPIVEQIKPYPKEYQEYITAGQTLSTQRTKQLKDANAQEQAQIQATYKKDVEDLQKKYEDVINKVQEDEKKYKELMEGKVEVEFNTFFSNSIPDMTANQLETIQAFVQ